MAQLEACALQLLKLIYLFCFFLPFKLFICSRGPGLGPRLLATPHDSVVSPIRRTRWSVRRRTRRAFSVPLVPVPSGFGFEARGGVTLRRCVICSVFQFHCGWVEVPLFTFPRIGSGSSGLPHTSAAAAGVVNPFHLKGTSPERNGQGGYEQRACLVHTDQHVMRSSGLDSNSTLGCCFMS